MHMKHDFRPDPEADPQTDVRLDLPSSRQRGSLTWMPECLAIIAIFVLAWIAFAFQLMG